MEMERRELHRTRLADAQATVVKNGIISTYATEDTNKKKNGRNHRRVFVAEVSITDWLVEKDSNFQAIYDAVLVQVSLFITFVILRDSYAAGRFSFDVTMLYSGLGSLKTIGIFLCVEACLLALAFFVHPCFMLWKWLRNRLPKLLVDISFIVCYACYVSGTAVAILYLVFMVPFPPYTTMVASIEQFEMIIPYLTIVAQVEQLRLSMKSYSFIRENAYKVLYPWNKDDEEGPAVWYAGQMEPKVGSFSKYLYFLFCPTLLYRDNYPRNTGPINWYNAAVHFLQFITTIWYLSVLYKDFLFPSSYSRDALVHCYLMCLLCTFFLFILVHTCILHAYMNFSSEVFRFADRKFYTDWWCSTSFSSYYRKWNLLVHDWIHSYLYLDMKALFRHSIPAMFTTILISGFFHEYLLSLALGFFSPVFLLEFAGLGVIFYCMKPFSSRRFSNFFVVWALSVGGANLVFYYLIEFAARQYCPKELTLATFFTPRMFECYQKFNS